MESYLSRDIRCPFYMGDDGSRRIRCEWLYPGAKIQQIFAKREDFSLHTAVFCCDRYRNCEIYTAVMAAKYPDQEETEP